eukprot:672821-Rhodomonas_salina.1
MALQAFCFSHTRQRARCRRMAPTSDCATVHECCCNQSAQSPADLEQGTSPPPSPAATADGVARGQCREPRARGSSPAGRQAPVPCAQPASRAPSSVPSPVHGCTRRHDVQ